MPDLQDTGGLFELFGLAGFVSNTGFGPCVLTWSELSGFCQIHNLNSNEAQTLRTMSENYLKFYNLGVNPLCIPPWELDDD